MSLFFGEQIVSDYPVSRAFDDEDDELTNYTIPPVTFAWAGSQRSYDCSTLLISVGPIASGFVDVYILDNQPSDLIGQISVATTNIPKDAEQDGRQPITKVYDIRRLTDYQDIIVVRCTEDIQPEQTFSFTQQLMSTLSPVSDQVVVLAANSLSDYKSALASDDLTRNFLRVLHSSEYKGPLSCAFLEQPNTISGLPAQLLTHCQVHRMSCVLYVCYADTYNMEAEAVKAFTALMRSPPFCLIAKANAHSNDLLSRIVSQHASKLTIFI